MDRTLRDLLLLLPVTLAPFLYGAVSSVAQAWVVAFISFAWVASLKKPVARLSRAQSCAGWLVLILFMLTVCPLPGGFISSISAAGGELHSEFYPAGSLWGTLSLSTSATIVRAWQLAAILTVFFLAQAASSRGFSIDRQVAWSLGAALAGLTFIELWRQFDGKGIWQNPANYPAGPFANRNHYCNWIVVASFVCLGRAADLWKKVEQKLPRAKTECVFLVILCLVALCTVIASGSRGGVLALLAGGIVFIGLVGRRTKHWRSAALASMIFVGIGIVVFGGNLRSRIDAGEGNFKIQLWQESVELAARFPLTGVGLGAFEPAFNHYKTFHGEGTFLFAENEIVQVLAECGFIGGIFMFFIFISTLLPGTRSISRMHGRHAFFGAGCLSALAAWVVHAQVEFVFQVFSTALLAALIAGICAGWSKRGEVHPIVPIAPSVWSIGRRIAVATALMVGAALQIYAHTEAEKVNHYASGARSAQLMKASRAWPFDETLQIAAFRTAVSENRGDAALLSLNKAILLDPLNWRLRLERAWYLLQKPESRALGVEEAEKVRKLNPLQDQLGWRFGESLKEADPVSARQFLREARPHTAPDMARTLEARWSIDQNPAALWELVPGNARGLKVLSDFAAGKGLTNLAGQALLQIPSSEIDTGVVGRLLALNRLSEAEKYLVTLPPGRKKSVLSCWIQLNRGNIEEAGRTARDEIGLSYSSVAELKELLHLELIRIAREG